ncbi:alpha amylase catalytic region [Xylanimonas cellulosilytica DSM 15894]|uniref:Alpha amylase catalytic region n=1 Tax=Xylanimonas cellulosilytica (strain DSM 15894 / JCM 12276 / CECT 5975 / KCTC 9989 / LMG 20990 / NBRC 107835 / XIL07) TaxID=446471 RepID=D1BTG1_XYLCX|nr:glycoside hydrolase family 13 protein [Xylanimonas cellulosilytica]ACZ29103.1 alpha amylase catalytic region [Xylanimonas cellulosilytica DSM 15894]
MTTSSPSAPDPHAWWRHAVIYQIYPRSFADGNGDGTGDLAGVRGRLPYLKELGVDAVWFTPWYVSPLADGGYDVADYRAIDPQFGTLAEAEALITEAAALGIRTIIDVVPNHVSSAHAWFQAALASEPGSPERARFWFHDGLGPDGSGMPTHWQSSFQGTTWTRTTRPDGTPGQWYLHLFTPEQPDLNWENPDVRQEHLDVLRFWFDRGAAGVRIDSAALPVKDRALPEVPEIHGPGEHPHLDRDELHDIYRTWRAVADGYDDPRILVGEVWLPDAERFAQYLRPDEMHTAFNFDFMVRPWAAAAMRESIDTTLAAHAPVDAPATWVLSNHDITRPVTRYGREDSSFDFARKRFGIPTDVAVGTRRARAAALLTGALPGALYVYQGDELGLPEVEDLPLDVLQDPMHFRSNGVDPGRDGCRVPLPWNRSGASYGFGPERPGSDRAEKPWLPQPVWWGEYAVEAQEHDPASMLTLYRTMLRLRRSLPDLAAGAFTWIEDAGADVLAFRRGAGFACVVNLGATPAARPDGEMLLASGPLAPDGAVPHDTAVWLRL